MWTRIENVDRTSELLLGKQAEPPGFDEKFLARIQAYTAGYDHDFPLIPGSQPRWARKSRFTASRIFLRLFTGTIPWELYCFYGFAPEAMRIRIEDSNNENISP